MQVPEKLTLIGGSILLASTLIFTLKSQASSILPKVTHPISTIQGRTTDVQDGNNFMQDFRDAHAHGQTTGKWGTALYYLDSQNGMHVGGGRLSGNFAHVVGSTHVHSVPSIDFEGKVQAPQDSSWLLATSNGFGDNDYTLQAIKGTQNIDTSQVKYMGDMFSNDMNLKSLDLSNWDTSHVVDMSSIFDADQSLQSLNVSDWNVSHVQNLSWAFYLTSVDHLDLSGWNTNDVNDTEEMFDNDKSLQNLALTHFNTSHVSNMVGMYNHTDQLSWITLGEDAHFNDTAHIQGNDWQNGSTRLSNDQLEDSTAHPGTWVLQ